MVGLQKENNMKNIFKSILLVAATATVASCDLNLAPNDSISYLDGAPIFNSESDIVSFRNGIYGYYRSLSTGTNNDYNSIVAKEVMCDGFNAHADYANNYGPIHRTDVTYTEGDYHSEYFWAENYFAIKDYNIVIGGADNCAAELEASARQIKGEACFFRAAAYLDLARIYGKAYDPATAETELCVPLVLAFNPNEKPARATVKQVYDAIKADLDTAAACLAGIPADGKNVTPDVVNALYARYYLDTKDYDKAASTAAALIDGGKYPLTDNAEDLYNAYINDSGDEAILKLYASTTEKGNKPDLFAGFYPNKDVEEGYEYTYIYYIPSKKLVDSYESGDYRLACWFDGEDYPVRVSGGHIQGQFYVFTKYIGNAALEAKEIPQGYNAAKPFLISEQYLIAAEAYQAGGQATKAAQYLNALQTARNTTTTTATPENIQKEWFRETVGEGLRISCLKRWNIGFNGRPAQDGAKAAMAVMTGAGFEDKVMAAGDNMLCWPIPSYERKINDNLVQNPGFSSAE